MHLSGKSSSKSIMRTVLRISVFSFKKSSIHPSQSATRAVKGMFTIAFTWLKVKCGMVEDSSAIWFVPYPPFFNDNFLLLINPFIIWNWEPLFFLFFSKDSQTSQSGSTTTWLSGFLSFLLITSDTVPYLAPSSKTQSKSFIYSWACSCSSFSIFSISIFYLNLPFTLRYSFLNYINTYSNNRIS